MNPEWLSQEVKGRTRQQWIDLAISQGFALDDSRVVLFNAYVFMTVDGYAAFTDSWEKAFQEANYQLFYGENKEEIA